MRAHRRALIALLTMGIWPIGACVAVDGQSPSSTEAGPAEEATAETCRAAVAAARALAEVLPAGDLSRRVAESHLVQATVEAGNGEFDDCLEMARHATVEIRERRHRSVPDATADDGRGR